MAQKRFIKYRDQISSFEANEKYAGIIPPSLYRGFDRISARSGLIITLAHDLTGERFSQQNLTLTPFRGVWMSQQGVVIKEDAPIVLPAIIANSTANTRYDLVVGVHNHDVVTPGGIAATYQIITGTGNMAEPTVPNPERMTVLGRFEIPPNASTAVAVVWVRRPIPQLGNKFPALLAEENRFTQQNQENQAPATITTQSFEITNRGVIEGLAGGNSFLVGAGTLDLMEDKPNGTLISLTFSANATLRGFSNQVTASNVVAGLTAGFRPLSLSAQYPALNIAILAGETATFRKVSRGGANTLRPFGEYWSLVGVTGINGLVVGLDTRMTAAETAITTLQTNLGTTNSNLAAHVANTNNPHGTTKDQVGLGNLPNAKSDSIVLDNTNTLATSKAVNDLRTGLVSNITSHTSNLNNPHNVTKAQVGLSNIPNSKSDSPTSNNSNVLATTVATQVLYNMITSIQGFPSGAIVVWSGPLNQVPAGWTMCNGLNGTPDLRGRFVLAASDFDAGRPIPPDDRGERLSERGFNILGGAARHALTGAENGPHTHSYNIRTYAGGQFPNTTDNSNSTSNTPQTTGSSGNGSPHNNMPPYYSLFYIMKL